MSNYARLRVVAEADSNQSYTHPLFHSVEADSSAADETAVASRVDAVTPVGTTYSLAHFTTVSFLMIEVPSVTGSTPYVTVTWRSADTNPCTARVTAGGFPLVMPDVNPALNLNLLSSAGTVPVKITVVGT